MLTTTERFDRVLRAGHVVAIKATLYPGGEFADAVVPVPLEVLGGQVTLDRTAAQRGRATLTTTKTTSVSAYGDEVHLERGIEYADGSTELVSLGWYRVGEVDDSILAAQLDLNLDDRSAQIVDDVPLAPVTFAAGGLTQGAIEDLVLRTHPSVTTHLPGDTHTLPQPVVVTDNPWQSVQDMATAIGCEAFFDRAGEFRLQAIPDASTATSVYQVDQGDTGVLVDAVRKQTRDSVKNGVRMIGEQLGKHPPVSAQATDDDPTSPTYWDGPFGHVPEVTTGQHFTNSTQAGVAAAARLRDLLGAAKSVTLTSVPAPQLEPGDCITVTYPADADEVHLLDQVVIPLTVTDSMSMLTRSQPA